MRSSWSPSNTPSTASWRLGGVFEFRTELLESRPGYIAFRVTGRDAQRAFAHESGGHRWQRVPPNEKRGRVHTSTITVAVLGEVCSAHTRLNDADIDVRTTGSGGPGGQHANKSETTVVMTHRPTGIRVRIESRSQHANRIAAREVLEARVGANRAVAERKRRNNVRRAAVGSGMRADKRRTVAVQRGEVVDHITGRRTSVRKYLRGGLDDLWPTEPGCPPTRDGGR